MRSSLLIRKPVQWMEAVWSLFSRIFFVLILAAGANTEGQVVSKEYQIKAAFLYNFTKFVEWPPERFPESSNPIIIGVVGNNSFTKELEAIVKDRTVNGRNVVVKIIESAAEARLAHVLFVNAGEEKRRTWLSEILGGRGVLTVGESELFGAMGGMINFTMEGDKVRFGINMGEAEKAGLKISAQLQKLAKIVRKKT